MLAILSPAKTLDYESPLITKKASEPDFVAESGELIEALRKLSPAYDAEDYIASRPLYSEREISEARNVFKELARL